MVPRDHTRLKEELFETGFCISLTIRTTNVGRGHVLLNQRLCLRGRSPLANRLDSATPFCSLLPPQAALANVPPPTAKRQTVRMNELILGR